MTVLKNVFLMIKLILVSVGSEKADKPKAPSEGKDTSAATGIKRPGQFTTEGKLPDPKRKRMLT